MQKPSYLTSRRLRLVPATLTLVRAEQFDQRTLARLLNAQVPENWPPLLLADALPLFLARLEENPRLSGWLSWYWIRAADIPDEAEGEPAVLIGSGGFTGLPDESGTVELGYSALPQYQGHGYATEALTVLVGWAFSQPDVVRMVADTLPTNIASRHVLDKLGFKRLDEAPEKGMMRFVLEANPTNTGGSTF